MSLIDLAGIAIKTVSGARTAGRMADRETPFLEEIHQNSGIVRAEMSQERAEDTTDQIAAADLDGSFLGDLWDRLTDLF